MTKLRVALFALTIVVVSVTGYFASLYARGYRLNTQTYNFEPRGLFVASSDPDGASIYVNGELKSATRSTTPLPPGNYDVERPVFEVRPGIGGFGNVIDVGA